MKSNTGLCRCSGCTGFNSLNFEEKNDSIRAALILNNTVGLKIHRDDGRSPPRVSLGEVTAGSFH